MEQKKESISAKLEAKQLNIDKLSNFFSIFIKNRSTFSTMSKRAGNSIKKR